MTTESEGTPLPAPSPAAKRMRLHRQRRRKGLLSVRLLLSGRMIEALIRRKYLDEKDTGSSRNWGLPPPASSATPWKGCYKGLRLAGTPI